MYIIYLYQRTMDIVKNEFLRPTLKLDDQKYEFIFLMDVSGSMAGSKMDLAKRALNVKKELYFLCHSLIKSKQKCFCIFFQLILHSLPATCYFNVIFFSDSYRSMFPQSQKYNQANLNQAKSIVSGKSFHKNPVIHNA